MRNEIAGAGAVSLLHGSVNKGDRVVLISPILVVPMRDREKVLSCLAQHVGINITRLGRETGLSWARLDRLLSELVGEGVIREARLELSGGRVVRMFFLKEAKP